MTVGPTTAVVRPAEAVCSRTTCAVDPKADSELSPLTVTAVEPLPPPKMTLTWLPAELTEAAPSRPVCAGGTVVTMLPVIEPYQR